MNLAALGLRLKGLTNTNPRIAVTVYAQGFSRGAVSNVVMSLANEGFTNVDVLTLRWGMAFPVPRESIIGGSAAGLSPR